MKNQKKHIKKSEEILKEEIENLKKKIIEEVNKEKEKLNIIIKEKEIENLKNDNLKELNNK